jgi:hypothetical protein
MLHVYQVYVDVFLQEGLVVDVFFSFQKNKIVGVDVFDREARLHGLTRPPNRTLKTRPGGLEPIRHDTTAPPPSLYKPHSLVPPAKP